MWRHIFFFSHRENTTLHATLSAAAHTNRIELQNLCGGRRAEHLRISKLKIPALCGVKMQMRKEWRCDAYLVLEICVELAERDLWNDFCGNDDGTRIATRYGLLVKMKWYETTTTAAALAMVCECVVLMRQHTHTHRAHLAFAYVRLVHTPWYMVTYQKYIHTKSALAIIVYIYIYTCKLHIRDAMLMCCALWWWWVSNKNGVCLAFWGVHVCACLCIGCLVRLCASVCMCVYIYIYIKELRRFENRDLRDTRRRWTIRDEFASARARRISRACASRGSCYSHHTTHYVRREAK